MSERGAELGVKRAAIVTGSDSGIGRATAVALASAGFDIGITWHSDHEGANKTAELVRKNGRVAHVRRLDLQELQDTSTLINSLAQALGRLDALINNAAVNPRAPLLEETLDGWSRTLDINLTGQLLCSQVAAEWMIRQGDGGRIVNVTSIHEYAPLRCGGAYAVAKAGLGMLTKVMALEWAEHAITVNSIAPGHVATPMNGFDDAGGGLIRRAAIPIGRIGGSDEVAATIAHLCSPEAAYVTGSCFTIDGGLSLMSVIPLQDEVGTQG